MDVEKELQIVLADRLASEGHASHPGHVLEVMMKARTEQRVRYEQLKTVFFEHPDITELSRNFTLGDLWFSATLWCSRRGWYAEKEGKSVRLYRANSVSSIPSGCALW